MIYRVVKEILEDGFKRLEMFDENDLPVCHFCTEPNPTNGYEIVENCGVFICDDCTKELRDEQAKLLRVDPSKIVENKP